jgi:hypothetical protein
MLSCGVAASTLTIQPIAQVQRHFHQLPGAAVESLRDSLMNLLLKHAKGHPPVRTQLCLALASLGVHLDRTHWGDKGIVIWLATALSRAPQDLAQPCMLELLHVLPQASSLLAVCGKRAAATRALLWRRGSAGQPAVVWSTDLGGWCAGGGEPEGGGAAGQATGVCGGAGGSGL